MLGLNESVSGFRRLTALQARLLGESLQGNIQINGRVDVTRASRDPIFCENHRNPKQRNPLWPTGGSCSTPAFRP